MSVNKEVMDLANKIIGDIETAKSIKATHFDDNKIVWHGREVVRAKLIEQLFKDLMCLDGVCQSSEIISLLFEKIRFCCKAKGEYKRENRQHLDLMGAHLVDHFDPSAVQNFLLQQLRQEKGLAQERAGILIWSFDRANGSFLEEVIKFVDDKNISYKTAELLIELIFRPTDEFGENSDLIRERLGMIEYFLKSKKLKVRLEMILYLCPLIRKSLLYPKNISLVDLYCQIWQFSLECLKYFLNLRSGRKIILKHFPFSLIAESYFWSFYQNTMLRLKQGEKDLTDDAEKNSSGEKEARKRLIIISRIMPIFLAFQESVERALKKAGAGQELDILTVRGDAQYRRIIYQSLEKVPKDFIELDDEKDEIDKELLSLERVDRALDKMLVNLSQ